MSFRTARNKPTVSISHHSEVKEREQIERQGKRLRHRQGGGRYQPSVSSLAFSMSRDGFSLTHTKSASRRRWTKSLRMLNSCCWKQLSTSAVDPNDRRLGYGLEAVGLRRRRHQGRQASCFPWRSEPILAQVLVVRYRSMVYGAKKGHQTRPPRVEMISGKGSRSRQEDQNRMWQM